MRENWHSRMISDLDARLHYLRGLGATVTPHRASEPGSDIEIGVNTRTIRLEVQQFDSGGPWKESTIPSWKRRHDLCTIIIFPAPTLERVLKRIESTSEYAFFKQPGVLLFADDQVPEIVALLGTLVLMAGANRSLGWGDQA